MVSDALANIRPMCTSLKTKSTNTTAKVHMGQYCGGVRQCMDHYVLCVIEKRKEKKKKGGGGRKKKKGGGRERLGVRVSH